MLDYNLPFQAFVKQLNDIDGELINHVNPKPAKKEYFNYIPNIQFSELIGALTLNPKTRFLDIGSGTGRILALRKYLTNSPVMGLEINKELAEAGMKEYDLNEIYFGDAFKLITPEFLKSASVIYTYMPIADPKLMRKLEIQIEKSARPYTLRIEMLPVYFNTSRNDRMPLIFEYRN